MATWRTLGALCITLAGFSTALAQPYDLSETVKAGDCFRLHLDLSLAGEMKVAKDGEVILQLTAIGPSGTTMIPQRPQ